MRPKSTTAKYLCLLLGGASLQLLNQPSFSRRSTSTHRARVGAQGLLRGNKFDDADSAKLRAKWQLSPAEERSFVIALARLFFFPIALAKLAIKSPHFTHQFKSYIVLTFFEVRNDEVRRRLILSPRRAVAVYRGNHSERGGKDTLALFGSDLQGCDGKSL